MNNNCTEHPNTWLESQGREWLCRLLTFKLIPHTVLPEDRKEDGLEAQPDIIQLPRHTGFIVFVLSLEWFHNIEQSTLYVVAQNCLCVISVTLSKSQRPSIYDLSFIHCESLEAKIEERDWELDREKNVENISVCYSFFLCCSFVKSSEGSSHSCLSL